MITRTLNPGAFQGVPVYQTRSLWRGRGLGQDEFIDTGGSDIPTDIIPPDAVPPDLNQEPMSVPPNSSPEGLPTTTTTETPPSQLSPSGTSIRPGAPASSSSSSGVGGVLDTIGKFFSGLFSSSANPSPAGRPGVVPAGGGGAQTPGIMSSDTMTLVVVGSITLAAVALTALLTRPTIVVASRGK